MRGKQKAEIVADVLTHRGQYAAFITLLAALIVLTLTSVMVLQFESRSSDANITSGADALWWAIVTITTVGYGDRFPVTALGRLTGVFVMFADVGIIGALASILASILVPPPREDAEPEPAAAQGDVHRELADIRQELYALRRSLESTAGDPYRSAGSHRRRRVGTMPTWAPGPEARRPRERPSEGVATCRGS